MLHPKSSKRSVGICVWVLQVTIVLTLVSLVVWLSLRPKTPVYSIIDVYFPALDVQNTSRISHTHAGRNTSLILNLEISNPNDGIGVYHDDISVSVTVHYSEVVSGVGSVPCFYQGHKKTTQRAVKMNANQQFWRSEPSGTIDLRVRLVTEVRYWILGSKTKNRRTDLEAHVFIGSDGRILGEKNVKLQITHSQ